MGLSFIFWKTRRLRRQVQIPSEPYVDIEGYPEHLALILIEYTMERRLE